MGLAWFGNMDWHDDRPPTTTVDVKCQLCGEAMVWHRPLNYHGEPPKHGHPCGGVVYRTSTRSKA